ncbi:sugar ABC transporter ATP-binding protein [Nocardioides sp.]|uniref:sugar ABC transporter ATP-binding protein n=1 Tax=Nocardioides sp. TaxID=35761 RepID=UPI00321B1753
MTTVLHDEPALRVSGLTKQFGGVTVLSAADLRVERGQIHALLGANGAGKSTLVKILSGVHPSDGGTIELGLGEAGKPGHLSFVHQDLGLVDDLTVRENLNLGTTVRPRRIGRLDHRGERLRAAESLARVDLGIDPETPLSELGLGAKTLVAVARVLADDASVIVLDEATAALTRRESSWLLSEIRKFTDAGGAAVLVTHRLQEVTEHCDAVTMLRDGQVLFTGATPPLHELHEMLSAGVPHAKATREVGPVLARATGATALRVGPVDVEVRGGEVLGLVGPLSSNLYAIGHLLAGHLALTAGTVSISTTEGGRGVAAIVPEDRRAQGLLHGLDVRDNLSVSSLRLWARLGFVRGAREAADADEQVTLLNVQPAKADYPILGLSGGNQQKVLMGRAKLRDPDVYILCEPTRGVDIGTRRALYKFIDDVCATGAGVVVLSIDLDDVMAVSDRVGVVQDGRIISVTDIDSVSPDEILEHVL